MKDGLAVAQEAGEGDGHEGGGVLGPPGPPILGGGRVGSLGGGWLRAHVVTRAGIEAVVRMCSSTNWWKVASWPAGGDVGGEVGGVGVVESGATEGPGAARRFDDGVDHEAGDGDRLRRGFEGGASRRSARR